MNETLSDVRKTNYVSPRSVKPVECAPCVATEILVNKERVREMQHSYIKVNITVFSCHNAPISDKFVGED